MSDKKEVFAIEIAIRIGKDARYGMEPVFSFERKETGAETMSEAQREVHHHLESCITKLQKQIAFQVPQLANGDDDET